ncbi:HAD family hydrolase [Paenibacillus solisilvae]|uniref:HAD family hydrolase n=1 Tax=Paenibacillus solisilvae TaxID=2486751 RepID=A0ABW0W4H6_9BACL
MTVEAVIFDLDNTLINRKAAFQAYSERFIDQFVELSEQTDRAALLDYMREADQDGYRHKRELHEQFLQELTMKYAETTVDELLQFWFAEFFKSTVLMQGAVELLMALRSQGIKLGLITNGSVHTQNAKLDQAQLRDFFDVIVVSDEVQIKKPDQRIFELALERLGAAAARTWYVGDHPVNDIKGARDAGLSAIWLSGFMEWDDTLEEPSAKIGSLLEILDIVNR